MDRAAGRARDPSANPRGAARSDRGDRRWRRVADADPATAEVLTSAGLNQERERRRIYRRPSIDAHHHLWDLGMDRHPWLRPAVGALLALGDLDPIRWSYLVDDYRRDAANQNVVATVHVEANWDRRDDPLAGDPLARDARQVLRRSRSLYRLRRPRGFKRRQRRSAVWPTCRRCVGVRQMLSWHPSNPARCFAPRAGDRRRGGHGARAFRCSPGYHLLLELMLYPYPAEELARLARDFADQPFVINHCGGPIDRDREGMVRWKEGLQIARLAAQRQHQGFGSDRL